MLDLYSLDHRVAAARARLATLDARASELRARRDELHQEIAVAERSTRLERRYLAAELRLLYEQGDVEPVEIVLGSENLDQALSDLDGIGRTAKDARETVRELEGARMRFGRAARELRARTRALAVARRAAFETTFSLERTRAERRAFIDSLAARRRLTEGQIARLVASAHDARERATLVASAPAGEAVVQAGPTRMTEATGEQTLAVVASGYSLGGATSTGLPAGWGVAAVDPSVIPLGTHMSVPGYGEAVAADTGGAIVGAAIDLWFPTTGRANAWGRRSVTVVLQG